MDITEYEATRTVIEYHDHMSFDEYLQEIDIYINPEEQYYQISVYTLRLKQLKELKECIREIVIQCNKNRFKLKTSLNMLNEIRVAQTENMDTLLDLFEVVNKSEIIDEHEAEKSYIFLSNQLIEYEQDNTHNKYILNTMIIKLNVEETIIGLNMKRYVERWRNYEDVYDRI
jgi:hypothetical protein